MVPKGPAMEVTRRQFLKAGAVGAGTIGASVLGFDVAQAKQVQQHLRIEGATVSRSVCPYCAVGCALLAYTRKDANGKVELLQIEGDPDSPVNEGRLCPKGATAMELAVSRRRGRVQLRGRLLRHQAAAGHRHRLHGATGPGLTRPHGDQFGRHVW
jgi:anaerobic selenocysteine-containing dehydrogenase